MQESANCNTDGMNNFSEYQVIWQENSLRCKTWSLALCNLFNSNFSVVSLLFVLGPSICFTCGWCTQSLWSLKLCLLLSRHENWLHFIWKETSAQLSSCSYIPGAHLVLQFSVAYQQMLTTVTWTAVSWAGLGHWMLSYPSHLEQSQC